MNAREILSARTIVISTEPHAKATPQQIPSLEASYASRNPATLVLEPQRYDGSSGVTVVPVPLPFTIKSLSLALYFSCVSLQLSIFRRNREYGRLCLRRFDPGPHMLRFIRLIAFLRVCTVSGSMVLLTYPCARRDRKCFAAWVSIPTPTRVLGSVFTGDQREGCQKIKRT
jgi:hypothetical protein